MSIRVKVLLLLLAFAFFLLSEEVRAQEIELGNYQFGFYHQTFFQNGKASPRFLADGYAYLSPRAGVWAFAYGEKQYALSVVGVFYDFFQFGEDSVFELGVAAGAETFPGEDGSYGLHPRAALQAFIGNDDFNAIAYYDKWSHSPSWRWREINLRVTERLTVGGFHQKGDGFGPRVVYSVSDSPISFWVGPMFHGGDVGILGGLQILFSSD